LSVTLIAMNNSTKWDLFVHIKNVKEVFTTNNVKQL